MSGASVFTQFVTNLPTRCVVGATAPSGSWPGSSSGSTAHLSRGCLVRVGVYVGSVSGSRRSRAFVTLTDCPCEADLQRSGNWPVHGGSAVRVGGPRPLPPCFSLPPWMLQPAPEPLLRGSGGATVASFRPLGSPGVCAVLVQERAPSPSLARVLVARRGRAGTGTGVRPAEVRAFLLEPWEGQGW